MAGAQDGLGQQQLAAQRGDGRRQIEFAALPQRLVTAGQQDFIGIDIAQRLQLRQQQRLAIAAAQEGFLQCAAGSARGQQDAIARKDKRIASRLGQKAAGKRVEKSGPGRDGEDVAPALGHGAAATRAALGRQFLAPFLGACFRQPKPCSAASLRRR